MHGDRDSHHSVRTSKPSYMRIRDDRASKPRASQFKAPLGQCQEVLLTILGLQLHQSPVHSDVSTVFH